MNKLGRALPPAMAALVLPWLIVTLAPGGGAKLLGFYLPLAAAAVFAGSLVHRLAVWLRAPAPWNISLVTGQVSSNPGLPGQPLASPAGRPAVVARLLVETVAFRALWRNLKLGWADGPTYRRSLTLAGLALSFHILLLLIVCGHLRFFWPAPPVWLSALNPPSWPFGTAFLLVTLALLGRRLRPPVSLFSQPADLAWLGLFINLAATGLGLLTTDYDQAEARRLVHNLFRLHYQPMALPAVFYVHLFQALVILAAVPHKFLHGPALWLTPTLNQANNSRAVRHHNPNNPQVPSRRYADYERDNLESLKAAGLDLEYPDETRPG